jgi:pantoate--beta-alanine ligase
MKVITTASEMLSQVQEIRSQGLQIGLVPTMGALHAGHLALISQSKQDNPVTICSIYVNQLQFNNPADYQTYPRDEMADQDLLARADCDFLFMPLPDQVFPGSPPDPVDIGPIGTVMEGKFRPGHFQGVAAVVLRLFDLALPTRAYFGLKDYQQFLVVRNVLGPMRPQIEIKGIPTVRDALGLAMSSRNARLSESEYRAATHVARALLSINKLQKTSDLTKIPEILHQIFKSEPLLRLEYFHFARASDLRIVEKFDPSADLVACIAFYAGQVRLIDNVLIPAQERAA